MGTIWSQIQNVATCLNGAPGASVIIHPSSGVVEVPEGTSSPFPSELIAFAEIL